MPELPDVEVYKRYVDSTSLHQTMRAVEIRLPDLLGTVSREELRTHLLDHSFQTTHRHGKYLFLLLNDGYSLVLHFGMTGFPVYYANPENASDHIRLRVTFATGYHFAYNCQRKLGLIDLTEDINSYINTKNLGRDAYDDDFTFAEFKNMMQNRRGAVKSALMNQNIIAGLGNIYSDEVLFQAGIHPQTAVPLLDESELKQIFSEIKRVLQTSIQSLGAHKQFPDTFLLTHRKPGASCPLCNGEIIKKNISGRSSYLCSDHQSK